MHIEKITLHRFKKYKDKEIKLLPLLSLVAGANNSGKTTILQALSVWEFCKTILEIEKGPESLRTGYKGQGLGIGSDEFSPLNIQSPRHLWTNLNPQKENEPDGYTLWIELHWSHNKSPRHLRIALSLANDSDLHKNNIYKRRKPRTNTKHRIHPTIRWNQNKRRKILSSTTTEIYWPRTSRSNT